MAQIVTITNPLTGQPAQVDQLEHTAQQIDDGVARAIGFGLGGQSKFISSSDDLNDVVYDGWYRFDAAPINAPLLDGVNAVGYSSMLVSNRDPSLYVTQEIFCYSSWEAFNCVLSRCRINGEWKPWEWVNPPMLLGVEYRTTERYLGKPVYTKTIDCGAGPNKTDKYVYFGSTTPNIDRVISIEGSNSDGGAFPYERKNDSDYLSSAKDYILIESTYDRSNVTIYATIKYTKTTD